MAVTVTVGTIAPLAWMQLLMHAVSVAAIPKLALIVIPKSIVPTYMNIEYVNFKST